MKIALVLYPGFTVLDIIGPFQVLVDVPDHDVVFVASEVGAVMDHTGRCPLVASTSFAECRDADVIVVPGGNTADLEPVVKWICEVQTRARWVTSVCTGSIYLAAAGLLNAMEATTHWRFRDELERYGATYSEQRVITGERIITAAGVSSGIDMALTLLDRLHGPLTAQVVQLAIEYDPTPPFNAGSPSKAPADVVAFANAFFDASA